MYLDSGEYISCYVQDHLDLHVSVKTEMYYGLYALTYRINCLSVCLSDITTLEQEIITIRLVYEHMGL